MTMTEKKRYKVRPFRHVEKSVVDKDSGATSEIFLPQCSKKGCTLGSTICMFDNDQG